MNSRGRHNSRASESNYRDSSSSDYRETSPATNNNISPSTNLNPSEQNELESFKLALKELTFNSRPIIEKLTGMARERAKSIPGQISRTILDNLVFNNPKLRSCFLFLIDSICKNVGEPYPASFVKHGLVSAYLRVYGEIWSGGDEGQKKDFLRVLPTWNGVIPAEALKQIEVKLGLPISTPQQKSNAHKSNTHNTMSTTTIPTTTTMPTTNTTTTKLFYSAKTLKLLEDLQGVFEKPPGPRISGIVTEIFKRLAKGGELKKEILNDLDFKAKMSNKSQIIEALKRLQLVKAAESPSKSSSNSTSVTSNATNAAMDTASDPVDTTTIASPSVEFNFELPPNFQIDLSLLSSIVELNKLNTNNSTSHSSSSTPQSPTTAIPSQTDKKMMQDKHFIDIPVNSAEFLITRPNLYQILYADLSLQCKTCAIRFRDTQMGQERMTEHLDSHFRRNMRLKEKSKRVMARDWFGSEDDWISAKQDSEAASERAVNIFEDSSLSTDQSQSSSNQLNDDVFVEATEEEQGSLVKCDICQEVIEVGWNYETEQWTFPACVRNNFGKILHSNCQIIGLNNENDEEVKVESKSKRVKKN